mgnify:CR=1 FL=1
MVKIIDKMPQDLTGLRFFRLTVLRKAEKRPKNSYWICRCDCGNSRIVGRPGLINNKTKSCGCLNREITKMRCTTHDMTHSNTYRNWTSMKTRCYNENANRFKHYGGRGIVVCDRWKDSFKNFLEDVGQCPRGYSLERIDNDIGYCKSNCMWIPRADQGKNKKTCVPQELAQIFKRLYYVLKVPASKIAGLFGFHVTTIYNHLNLTKNNFIGKAHD